MLEKLKKINVTNIIPRLISVWLLMTSLNLIKDNNFHNISYLQNTSIIMYGILFILIYILYTVINKYFKKINIDSLFMLVNYLICTLIWLKNFNNNFFLLLAILIFFYIIIFNFINKNEYLFKKIKINNKIYKTLLILIPIIPFIILLTISILRYYNFFAPNFDFGIFSHIFYNLKESFQPLSTCERDILLSHFAVHFSPILYFILPIYFLCSHPITLQVIQSILVFSGIIPIIKLCQHFKLSKNKTIILSLLYSFYPVVTCGCLYDFHENAFLLPFLLWMFYFFEKDKKIPMYLFIILTLLIKEDAAIYIMIFALYQILSRKKYLQGTIILIISITYFLLATYIINKFGLGIMSDRFANITYNDSGLIGAIKTFIINPGLILIEILTLEKLKYLLLLFIPFTFLPFITKNLSRYILLSPILINIITDYLYSYDITFHYTFAITAFLFYISIQNLSELKSNTIYILGFSLISCLSIYYCYVIPSFTSNINHWNVNQEQYLELEKTLKSIPQDASINASALFVPHLTNRKEIYEVYYHENKLDTDYVILDMRFENNLETINHYITNNYELILENDLIVILKRK